MPSPQNITSPITLIANGRSGTSLLMNVLRAHPDVTPTGETAQIVFGVWNAVERARGVIRPDPELGGPEAHDARCAKAVRAAMLATFPEADTPRWMQKPIGLPWVLNHLPGAPDAAARGAWYWNAFSTSFPDAQVITILRHPYDVVLSAAEFWGSDHRHAWARIVDIARVLDHPDNRVGFAVSHARMVSEPEAEVARLLDHLGLSHAPACFGATGKVYMPKRRVQRAAPDDAPEVVERGFARRAEWENLDRSGFTDAEHEVLVRLWARFGERLDF